MSSDQTDINSRKEQDAPVVLDVGCEHAAVVEEQDEIKSWCSLRGGNKKVYSSSATNTSMRLWTKKDI